MTTDQYQSRTSLNKEADPNNSAETTLNYRRQTWNAEKDDLRNLLRSNSSLTHELVKMTRLKGTEFTVIEGIYLQGKTVSSIAKDYKMPITKLIDTEKFVVTKLLLAYQQYLTRYPSTNRLKDLNRQIGLYRDKKIPEDHIETIPEPEPISDKNNYVDSDRSSQVIAVTEKLTSKQVPDTGSQTVDLEDIVQVKAVKDDEETSLLLDMDRSRKSIFQIGEELGINPGEVQFKIYSAIQKFKEAYTFAEDNKSLSRDEVPVIAEKKEQIILPETADPLEMVVTLKDETVEPVNDTFSLEGLFPDLDSLKKAHEGHAKRYTKPEIESNSLAEMFFLNAKQYFVFVESILKGKSQKKLAKDMGLSQGRISQLEAESIFKLAKLFKKD